MGWDLSRGKINDVITEKRPYRRGKRKKSFSISKIREAQKNHLLGSKIIFSFGSEINKAIYVKSTH